MRLSIPPDELMHSGHLACQGCGAALAMRYALKALGPNTILDIPACCWSVISGPFPHAALKVPAYHTAFETGASLAAGIRAATRVLGKDDTTVMAWAGDGGTFDIGLQALSASAERNDDFIYTVYDNEAYMNTGIQRSSATPYGAWTTTTPAENFKQRPKKDIVRIMAAHRISYIATGSVAYPEDLIRKYTRAKAIKGMRFLHVFAPCPVGWRAQPQHTIKLARLAVGTRLFPLLEIEDGIKWRLTMSVPKPKPVSEYLALQGRFKHLTGDEVATIQANVERNWSEIAALVAASAADRPTAPAAAAEPSAGDAER
jgi:pyruvate/2-oxoacid:ferredoxin oxidoreductase beta subunit